MMKSPILTALVLMIFATGTLKAQNTAALPKLKTYYLVMLKKGPDRNQDSTAVARIQEEHLAHLMKMNATGKMCMAGPMGDDGDIRGICVYTTATLEEAITLASNDPAVKSGRLTVEAHPWMAQPGGTLP